MIELLGQSSDWLSLAQIVKATGTSPPTCLSILRCLVVANWVDRHDEERKYRLGPALHGVISRHDYWSTVAGDVASTLGSQLGYASTVGMRAGSELTTLYDWLPVTVSHPSLRGVNKPFAAPLGAAIAAVLPPAEQRAWLDRGKQANPRLNTQWLTRVLAGIRDRGFNVYHPQPDEVLFTRMLISGASDLHYPTVKTLLAMMQQPLAPEDFKQLGSLPIGLISAAAVAKNSGVTLTVGVDCASDVLPRQRCFQIGARVQEAIAEIVEAFVDQRSRIT